MTEYNVEINGICVQARYSDRAIHDIFLPLLRKLTVMQKEAGRRILVMLAAPPGSGKSTLLSFLEKLSEDHEGPQSIQVIGMDGFHKRQDYLISHYVTIDGKRIPMVDIKGAPVTFDLEQLTQRIRRIASGDICGWPAYDRLLHDPVPDAVIVNREIVILEGNYLLLDEDGWRDLSEYADYTISISAGEDLLRSRLIDRKIKTGASEEAAIRFVDFSDISNVRLCLNKTLTADLQLLLDDEGEYWDNREDGHDHEDCFDDFDEDIHAPCMRFQR